MKKRRVLVLTHEDLVAPESLEGLDEQQRHEADPSQAATRFRRDRQHGRREGGAGGQRE